MAGRVACTIIAKNYLAQARTWAESVRRFDASTRLVVLVVDHPFGASWTAPEELTVVGIGELGIPRLESFLFRYELLEVCTAVKPWLLEYLLERFEPEYLYYFDPDIMLFGELGGLDAQLEDADVALTPHLGLEGSERMREVEISVLKAGTYNLGFIGMANTRATRLFLRWWRERLENDCVSHLESGLFVDQKWLNIAAAALPRVATIRDPGCNVAYWNIHQRTITRDVERYRVNGRPLVFFHFSGYSPSAPDVISKHLPRARLGHRRDLQPIFAQYAEQLARHDYFARSREPSVLALFSDGTPIPREMRRLFASAEQIFPARWPSPRSVVGDDSFAIWALRGVETISPFTKYLLDSRPDLQHACSSVLAESQSEKAAWLRSWSLAHMPKEYGIPESWARRAQWGSTEKSWLRAARGIPSDAVAWFLERVGDDPAFMGALRMDDCEAALRQLAGSCVPGSMRTEVEDWLVTRPLRRAWLRYACLVDMHDSFRLLWIDAERERCVSWMMETAPSLNLGPEDLALFELSLRGDRERTTSWSVIHNAALRAEYLHVDPHEGSAAIRRELEAGSPDAIETTTDRRDGDLGVNLIGYYDACSGVGEAARSMLTSMAMTGLPSAIETLPSLPALHGPYRDRHDPCLHSISILNLNVENLLWGWGRTIAQRLRSTYRIGASFWELDALPSAHLPALELVEEIWAASRFVQAAFREVTTKPVHYVPLALGEIRLDRRNCRDELAFSPGQSVFLTICDAHSHVERKNPFGAIEAFRRAGFSFPRAKLVVRVSNAEPSLLQRLHCAARGLNLLVLSDPMERSDFLDLLFSVDAVVSLHRSEGFGLPLAEALALARPVIATSYGGNMDFTTPETAFLVEHECRTIGVDVGPYPATGVWAEPNLDSAAAAMRAIAESPDEASLKARRGQELVRAQHAHEVVAPQIRERLLEVSKLRKQ